MSESIRVLDLRDYWRMIRTRVWTVLAMATIVAAIAGAYIALRPPMYFSQAKVIVDPLVNPAITGSVGNPTAYQPDMVVGRFEKAILLLEVLGPQEEALGPKHPVCVAHAETFCIGHTVLCARRKYRPSRGLH